MSDKQNLATRKDVEGDSFAEERGIEIGGGLWELTGAGRSALQPLKGQSNE